MMEPQGDRVLRAIGREPSERGVIQVADQPAAIEALQKAIAASQAQENSPANANDDQQGGDDFDDVPFYARAQPFLELLKQSQAEGKDVVWGV